MKNVISLGVVFLIAGAIFFELDSRSFRVTQIPNGSKFSCANCHVSAAGGGTRNQFGQTIENAFLVNDNVMWDATLASLDSDGDGFSNGVELQDPNGSWRTGQGDPGVFANVTNPGDPNSKPAPNAIKELNGTPEGFALFNNYPNPFNPSTRIRYSVPVAGNVSLKVYSLNGETVFSLVDQFQEAGTYEVDFTAVSVASGVYFYKLESAGNVQVKKMNLMK
ncbi:MAG: T9SS type A sorting domain-containing protein [Bacteroidetes bacterium]|nr:T9SS type A sorting domain-containing protein [Bacteroidota bacterium]